MVTSRRQRWAFAAGALSLGAPLGWLAICVGVRGQSVHGAVTADPWLFVYLLLGTAIAFVAFGATLGHYADRLTAANRELEHLAQTDALTGLHNARHFHTRLYEEAARAQRVQRPVSLVMVDLDHFKRVNDRYGHPVGDEVLAHAAAILRQEVRLGDTPFRIGGEEFVVLCPEAGTGQAVQIAERVRAALERAPAQTRAGPVPITGSFGVATLEPGAEDVGLLITASDAALYRAKAQGRNRVERAEPQVP